MAAMARLAPTPPYLGVVLVNFMISENMFARGPWTVEPLNTAQHSAWHMSHATCRMPTFLHRPSLSPSPSPPVFTPRFYDDTDLT